MDDVFRALADPTRRLLLDRLFAENGQTLSQLCERMGMTRQAVTKHIAILEAANLVTTVRQGRQKLHYLNPVPIGQIYERWIGKYERERLRALNRLGHGMNDVNDEQT
ncbi:MAG TPA: metalloregulator ArsR/SmtB family transcription factor [Dehalococcoidia bacterium]|nr:metalloregulator ArsR/SmtB family transcription factor [Dehalococcoidia bacterium]